MNYLDNAATSYPKPPEVIAAMTSFLTTVGVGTGRGSHRLGLAANRTVYQARERIAELFHLPDSSRVIFTHSCTESLNLAVTGLLRPGDHLVTSSMEHNSLVRPLHRLATTGVAVTKVACDRDGFLDPRHVAAALRPETRLIALSHCSNVTGAIQPVAEIGALARSRGILFLLDGAQSAGYLPLDVTELSVDLLAAPGHKGLLGPQGTGFLYIAPGLELEPLLVGGTGGASSDPEQPKSSPERYESGTPNTPGIAGLSAGVDILLQRGVREIRRHELLLTGRLLEGVQSISGVTLHGPSDPQRRVGVISLTLAGRDPSQVGFLLDQEFQIVVRVGLHCAPDAHRTIGTYPHGTIRVSPGYATTKADVDAFLHALRSIAGL
jgi:cysteine desulfurase / selenocysteine lyase